MGMNSQREVGADTTTMLDALRSVGRQGPDVIFLSSLNDPDVAVEALRAAGSGRLVVAVGDELSATEAVQSLVDAFPPHRQERAREQVANVLCGVVAQRLLERADGRGRVPAVEVLINTPKMVEGIASGMPDLERLVAEGEYYGMQTFDQALFQLHRTGVVSLRDALAAARQQEDLRIAFQQAGLHA
jgi:twitching motility protein PilT